MPRFSRVTRDDRGVSAIEYAVIASLISVSAVIGMSSAGTSMNDRLVQIAGFFKGSANAAVATVFGPGFLPFPAAITPASADQWRNDLAARMATLVPVSSSIWSAGVENCGDEECTFTVPFQISGSQYTYELPDGRTAVLSVRDGGDATNQADWFQLQVQNALSGEIDYLFQNDGMMHPSLYPGRTTETFYRPTAAVGQQTAVVERNPGDAFAFEY